MQLLPQQKLQSFGFCNVVDDHGDVAAVYLKEKHQHTRNISLVM